MKNKLKGFTLIELVVVILVTGIIIVGVSNLLALGFKSYAQAKDIIANTQRNIQLIEYMARDLRTIRSSSDMVLPTADPNTGCSLDSDSFCCLKFTNATSENVTYIVRGISSGNTKLMREGSGGNSQVATNVTTSLTPNCFNIGCYNANGTSPANAAAIRYCTVRPGDDFSNQPEITVFLWNAK